MSRFPHTELLARLGEQMPGGGPPEAAPLSGGSIASAWHLRQGESEAFLKLMPAGSGMLAAEADGLAALARAGGARVPAVLDQGEAPQCDWLLLQWLPLEALRGEAWVALGEALAAQHAVSGEAHGWHRDNFIGATPQPNPRRTDWSAFFREARLGFQLEMARERGLDSATAARVEKLMAVMDVFLEHAPAPSLLHGDLWMGNVAAVAGEPVIYDPAVHYGDREADLAMLTLFGAPPDAFWRAYEAAWPLPAGHEKRRDLYNLYHLLNHYNLFGGGYAGQVRRVTDGLLAEAGA